MRPYEAQPLQNASRRNPFAEETMVGARCHPFATALCHASMIGAVINWRRRKRRLLACPGE
jgi:hypothetical protein